MSTLSGTLRLYGEAAGDAASSMARSAWAIVALLVIGPALAALAIPLAPLGIVGGFILGILQAVAIGWYLALLDIAVQQRRRIKPSDLQGQLGSYWSEVISVLFVFFLGKLVLAATVPQSLPLLIPIAALVFNPAPEMIYQERSQSVGLLGDAARFMQHNWPEWLGPHLIAAGVLSGWAWFVGSSAWSVQGGLQLVQMFGPFFGFTDAFALLLKRLDGVGIVAGLLLLAFVHYFALFRGHLYRRLRSSSRRSRAWASRV